MAITQETLRLVEETRAMLEELAAGPTRSLTAAWIRAWDTLVWQFGDAILDLIRVGGDRWPTRAEIDRAGRSQQALYTARRALEQLAQQARNEIATAAATAIHTGVTGQEGLITSQLPASSRLRFNTLHENQIAAVVERTAQQIHAVTWPLSDQAVEAMKQQLVRGMVMGDNPRTIAPRILARVEGEFNGGLARALNIARTEILDGHRAAAMLSQRANADVLDGWQWTAHLSNRTCASCWSKHGNIYPITDPGPWDHQSGRCARVPVTRPWRDLGFNIPEPPSIMPNAQATFRALPKADQLHIMGPARLQMLDRGDITWADLSRRRTTSGWRDSYTTVPLKDLTPVR